MAVQFRCPCGAILHASERLVDSVKACPHCHANLRIPPAANAERTCVSCKQLIPHAHSVWARGRRICWKCVPPAALHIDLNALREHRKHQLETIRKARIDGLHYFQYHAPFEAAHNEIQVTADEMVFHEKEWTRITPAWAELGLIPFDMGSFMGVSLSVARFNDQAEESKKYLQPLLAFVKMADELPLASIPKSTAPASGPATAPGPAANPRA